MRFTTFFPDAVLQESAVLEGFCVVAENGKIRAVLPHAEAPQDTKAIKLEGLTLAAGLVDAQVNGGGGVLFNDAPTALSLKAIAAAHRACGTAFILPTLISDTFEKIEAALDAVKTVRRAEGEGSAILGLHLEGPFLNTAQRGCHPEKQIQEPDVTFLESLNRDGAGVILLTLAPEFFTAEDIRRLRKAGYILSAGHSRADAETLKTAREAGLSGITHLYNAMGGMSARLPGLSGAALDDNALACSVIADGHHVAPSMIRLAIKAKPAGKLFLVSDAMPPAGQNPPQDFTLFGRKILARDGCCKDAEGHLAGAALPLFDTVRFAVKEVGLPLPQAFAMASACPARFLGLAPLGTLTPGTPAAMVAFDNTLTLQKVINT